MHKGSQGSSASVWIEAEHHAQGFDGTETELRDEADDEKPRRWRSGILHLPRWAQRLTGVAMLLACCTLLVGLRLLPGADEAAAGNWHSVFRHWRWNDRSTASAIPHVGQDSRMPFENSLSSAKGSAVLPLPKLEETALRFLASDSSLHSSTAGNGTSSSSHASGCGRSHGAEHTLEGTLAFLMSCFILCCVLEHLNLLVPAFCRLPISVVMFVVGKVVGTFCLKGLENVNHRGKGFDNLIEGLQGAAWFDPHALLYVILPPLLYESAASMSWRVLRKVLPSAMLLAVPGVLLNTLLTGLYVKAVVRVQGQVPAWETAWLLSSILSATDPVAVVAALAELGAPQKLSALIEGESLLNDGTAVVATYVLRDWVMGAGAPSEDKFCPGSPPTATCIGQYFFQVAFGGCLVGLAAGLLLAYWVTHIRHHHHTVLEISIILTSVYSTFFVAEALATSGVLAVVTLGFMMSAHISARLSAHGRHNHHVVLAQIGYACNQVAFLGAGIISARFLWGGSGCHGDHTAADGYAWMELAGLYVTIHLTRACVVAVFLPFLRRLGYGLTWKESTILVYGGLRGAVGLVMSLIVEHSEYIDSHVSQMVAFHTSGIVLFTLLINGLSIQYLYRGLDLYPANPFRRTYLRKILAKLETECQRGDIRQIAKDWFFWTVLIAKILRGVPNFKMVQFGESGSPVPTGIFGMHRVLKSIEHSANVHMQEFIDQDPSSFEKPFGVRWDTLKAHREQDFASRFTSLLNECMKITLDQKDHLVRGVIALEDSKLGYRPEGAGHGLYVSMRSVYTLAGDPLAKTDRNARDEESDSEDEEMMSFEFEVEVLRFWKAARIVVGLISSPSRIQPPCPEPEGDDKLILGHAIGTVGLDTYTGLGSICMERKGYSSGGRRTSVNDFEVNDPEISSMRLSRLSVDGPVDEEDPQPIFFPLDDACECGNVFMDEDIICRMCGRRRDEIEPYLLEPGTRIVTRCVPVAGSSREWEVVFTARQECGRVMFKKRIPMGRQHPAHLYPAIEFIELAKKKEDKRHSQAASMKRLAKSLGKIGAMNESRRNTKQIGAATKQKTGKKTWFGETKRDPTADAPKGPEILWDFPGNGAELSKKMDPLLPCQPSEEPLNFEDKPSNGSAAARLGALHEDPMEDSNFVPIESLDGAWEINDVLNCDTTYVTVATAVENVSPTTNVFALSESSTMISMDNAISGNDVIAFSASNTMDSGVMKPADSDLPQFCKPTKDIDTQDGPPLPNHECSFVRRRSIEVQEQPAYTSEISVALPLPKDLNVPHRVNEEFDDGLHLQNLQGCETMADGPGSVGMIVTDTITTVANYDSEGAVGSGSLRSNDSHVAEMMGKMLSFAAIGSKRSSDTRSSSSLDSDEENCDMAAAVMVSFELQLATGSDSINELFTVLFNTVRMRYHEMHENGVLSDLAFSWLSESVGEALDCAGREVNSLGAANFKRGKTLTSLGQDQGTDWGSRMSKMVFRGSKGSKRDSEGSEARRHVIGEGNPERRKLASLFEPMLVEYMSIEKKVSHQSFWDRFPPTWELCRQHGYPVTSAKVEAMWAFVLAHEHVIKECPTLERFPAMQLCIHRVIKEMKSDLILLEELQPRRFFYSKHILALRVVMKRRLDKLHKFVDEGWLNAADGDFLVEIFQERLNEAEQYFPRLHSRAMTSLTKSDRRPSVDASNAWKDLDLHGLKNSRLASTRTDASGAFGLRNRSTVENPDTKRPESAMDSVYGSGEKSSSLFSFAEQSKQLFSFGRRPSGMKPPPPGDTSFGRNPSLRSYSSQTYRTNMLKMNDRPKGMFGGGLSRQTSPGFSDQAFSEQTSPS